MSHVDQRPPVSRWELYTQAARRSGLTPRQYREVIDSDPTLRIQRLGKRGLLHIAGEDADAVALRLNQGASA